MTKRILIINGNPATVRQSFSSVLANAYRGGAQAAGHEVRSLAISALRFDPILHEGLQGDQLLEPDLVQAQVDIRWAEHLVFIFPMWQLGIPALLKGFCERTLTPGFAYALSGKNPLDIGLLKGRSVRLIQTMSMPEALYVARYRAHGTKAFRSALAFCGMGSVKMTFLGQIEASNENRQRYLAKIRRLGVDGN